MSALKKLTASACVAALVSVAPLASAQAGDYYHGGHGYYDDYHYGGHYGHGYHKRHHGHHGYHKKKRGKAWVPVAIVGGIAAAYLIGKAIEDNHHKKSHYRGGYNRPHGGYNQGSYQNAPPPAPAPTGHGDYSGLAGGPGTAAPISTGPISTGPCRTVYRDGFQNGQPVQIASTLCHDQNGFGYIMPNSEHVVANGYGR